MRKRCRGRRKKPRRLAGVGWILSPSHNVMAYPVAVPLVGAVRIAAGAITLKPVPAVPSRSWRWIFCCGDISSRIPLWVISGHDGLHQKGPASERVGCPKSATSGRRDFGPTHNLRLRCFGSSAPDLHRPFSHSHAGPADVILTNKFTASVLKGGADRPHCTWPKRLPALKSGNGVRGHLCGAGQITHAPTQCSAGHSALYRQQFVTRFRLLLLIAGHVSIVMLF